MSLIKTIEEKLSDILDGYSYNIVGVNDNGSRGTIEVNVKFNPPITIEDLNNLVINIRETVKHTILENSTGGLLIPSVTYTFNRNQNNNIISSFIIIEVN